MENFVLPRMPYMVCIYMGHTFITRKVHRRFYGLDLKGNGRLGLLAIVMLDLSMMKKTAADLKAKRRKKRRKKPGSARDLLG